MRRTRGSLIIKKRELLRSDGGGGEEKGEWETRENAKKASRVCALRNGERAEGRKR
jgi:hypothetical protein